MHFILMKTEKDYTIKFKEQLFTDGLYTFVRISYKWTCAPLFPFFSLILQVCIQGSVHGIKSEQDTALVFKVHVFEGRKQISKQAETYKVGG